jgi:hypothetical protein
VRLFARVWTRGDDSLILSPRARGHAITIFLNFCFNVVPARGGMLSYAFACLCASLCTSMLARVLGVIVVKGDAQTRVQRWVYP